jgi:hypothetical protein
MLLLLEPETPGFVSTRCHEICLKLWLPKPLLA